LVWGIITIEIRRSNRVKKIANLNRSRRIFFGATPSENMTTISESNESLLKAKTLPIKNDSGRV
jgi:hypothetical protein